MFRLGSDNRFTLFTLFREEAGLTLRVPTHGPEDAFGVRVGDVGLIRDMKSRTSRLPCTGEGKAAQTCLDTVLSSVHLMPRPPATTAAPRAATAGA